VRHAHIVAADDQPDLIVRFLAVTALCANADDREYDDRGDDPQHMSSTGSRKAAKACTPARWCLAFRRFDSVFCMRYWIPKSSIVNRTNLISSYRFFPFSPASNSTPNVSGARRTMSLYAAGPSWISGPSRQVAVSSVE
jgi:hypothetical protein